MYENDRFEIDKERFGAFLLRLRKEKGLTQKELAELLFVSDKAVSKWERALSLPDVSLLIPLADCLGVSVAELLRGERDARETLPAAEVEALVGSALRLREEENRAVRGARRRWRMGFWACALAGLGETAALLALGFSMEDMSSTVLLVEGLCLLFGAWLCFWVKERLPTYYDENRITSYSDGFFRMNLVGVRFHNGNWPHILSAMRWWILGALALYPLLWGVVHTLWPGHALTLELPLTLAVVLGVLAAAVIAGKKYE